MMTGVFISAGGIDCLVVGNTEHNRVFKRDCFLTKRSCESLF